MKVFRDISLHYKIMQTILFLTITVSGLSIAVFISNDMFQYRKLNSLFNDIINQVGGISSEMMSNDFPSAYKNLNYLKNKFDVKTAEIYFYNGNALVKYPPYSQNLKTFQPSSDTNSIFSFFDKKFELFYPVIKKGKTIGAIYILTNNFNVYLYAIIEIVVVITMIAIFVATFLGEYITQPLSYLVSAIKTVSKNDYSIRIKKSSEDEVGVLVDSFNHMLEKIQINNKALIKTSRLAGMAEVSASIMHNVGNVLNSVNITSNILHSKIEKLKIAELALLANLLTENKSQLGPFFTKDEKGKRFIGYLTKLADLLIKEQQSILAEIVALNKNIGHIKRVFASQQFMIKVKGVIGQVLLSDLVKDVVSIHQNALLTNNILLEIDDTIKTPVSIDRTNVEQILINFIHNAIDALIPCTQKVKKISLKTWIDEREDMINIQVSDNGVGIPPENLNSIFEFGFTTKTEGHGFGLHVSALAAKELGGEIEVTSAGVNKGASFTLKLPAYGVDNIPATETT